MSSRFNPGPIAEDIVSEYREFAGGDFSTWHFPMMNDAVRNAAYEAALRSALVRGGTVLDIGSGSGLLAMLAVRHGASRVVTCEEIPIIARKATEIIRVNGMADRIQVINKLSTQLVIGRDFQEPADILVTEIFDDGLLGERAFLAIGHAKKNLLKPNAQVIPCGARVLAMCIESNEIYQNHRVTQAAGFDVSAFNEFSVNNYTGYHLEKMEFRPLTEVKTVFQFDFNQIPGDESEAFEFEVTQSGLCHGIAYWFELQMDQKIQVSSAPGLPQLSSWKQAVEIFETPRPLIQGKRFRLVAHHDDEGIWFTR